MRGRRGDHDGTNQMNVNDLLAKALAEKKEMEWDECPFTRETCHENCAMYHPDGGWCIFHNINQTLKAILREVS